MSEVKRVTVGIPCYDHFKVEMAISLIQAFLQGFPYELHLTVQRGTYIAEGREMCVRHALEAKSDVLMFIDTDIVFPPDGIHQLISLGKDIAGGNYHEKHLPLTSTVKLPDFEGKDVFYRGEATLPDQPFRAAAVATGCREIGRASCRERV